MVREDDRMAKSDDRKETLAKALLVRLANRPDEPISVSALAKDCGLSRQSFYYHFKSLHELYAWTLHYELMRTVRPVRADGWKAELQAILERIFENRTLVERISSLRSNVGLDDLLKQEMGIHVMRIVEEISTGLDIAPSDRALIARFYTAGIVEIVRIWIDDGMRESPERLAERLALFFVNSSELLKNIDKLR